MCNGQACFCDCFEIPKKLPDNLAIQKSTDQLENRHASFFFNCQAPFWDCQASFWDCQATFRDLPIILRSQKSVKTGSREVA